MDRGRLPHLAGLRDRGLFARLNSTVPDTSLAAWTAALTGVGPGRHGLVNFVRRQPGGYRLRLVDATDRLAPTILSLASRAGLRVAGLGVPGTYPPERVAGVCIAGFDSPVATSAAARAYYPSSLHGELRARGLVWPYGGVDELRVGPGWHARARRALVDGIEHKSRAIEAVLERGPFDLLWVVFSESDTAAHHFWAFFDPRSPRHRPDPDLADTLGQVYGALDTALGRLLRSTGDRTAVLVLSDHGACGASDHVVYLNRWLAREGLLRFAGVGGLVGRAAGLVRDLAARHLPAPVKQAVLRSPAARLALAADGLARFGGLDLSGCRAFSDELPQNPGIWIHLRGRDPYGTVEPGDEYERLRDRIADRLLRWRWREDHTKRPVVARVLRREDVFSGVAASRAPDLLVDLARFDGYRLVAGASQGRDGPLVRRLLGRELIGSKGTGTSGAHAAEGILVASGPTVRTGRGPTDARLVDICPTALRLLGLEPPPGLDGRPLEEIAPRAGRIFSPKHRPGSAAREAYSAEEEEAIRRRLEGLGYL